MSKTWFLVGALLWAFWIPIAAAVENVPVPVRKTIDAYKIPDGSFSLIVQDVASATPLLNINPKRPRNPASTIKLLTTFVALDVLGPTYTWPTKLYALGPIKDGVLDGSLLMKGYGDPYLVVEEFWKMLGALRSRGIDTINGDLVIDDSHFSIPTLDPAAFDRQPYRLYNVIPNAALVNFQAVEFQFTPTGDGRTVRISVNPALPNLDITNRLSIKKGPCRGYQMGIKMDVPAPATADRVVFSGSFPSACRSHSLHRSVLRPASYAFGTFQRLWGHWGGTISGGVRQGLAPPTKRPLVVWQSPPLAEIIRAVNKWSNNVMTRLLLYSLAVSKFDPPVTKEQGIEVLRDYLKQSNLDDTDLTIDNGSGLSRNTRVTAELMNDLLRHAYRDPYMPEFIASLSINGLDGTTRRRLRDPPEFGRMHLKTGRLDDVAAIAGYVVAASGTTYSVVLMINHTDVHRGPGRKIQDALLTWVHRQ